MLSGGFLDAVTETKSNNRICFENFVFLLISTLRNCVLKPSNRFKMRKKTCFSVRKMERCFVKNVKMKIAFNRKMLSLWAVLFFVC